jgi:NitT/TauT family transport system ATP-binding protein
MEPCSLGPVNHDRMISFDSVTKAFPHNGSGTTTVLRNLSFDVRQGDFTCILGPSGCGKSTLLNLVAGFLKPDTGSITIDQKPVQGPGPDRAMVFQDPTLFPWLTVLQNIMFGLRRKGLDKAECRRQAMHYLEFTGLGHAAAQYPYALSGGMRQRAAIARVLALHPMVLLMDEPFSALDANTREHLQEELQNIHSAGKETFMYVTHSVSEAAYLADRIIILGDRGTVAHDIEVTIKRPRKRSSTELLELKTLLRSHLAHLPCCMTHTTRKPAQP